VGYASTAVDWSDFKSWVRRAGLEAIIFNEQQSWEVVRKSAKELDTLLGTYVVYYTPETIPFFKLYDFILCNAKCHQEVFKDHPQTIYIPWGTDLNLFSPAVSARRDSVTFFHTCGVSPKRKGTDILVKSFKEVAGSAKLVIHSQAPLEPSLFDLRLDGRIQVIERDVPPPGLYSMGDVFVYPTRLEGLGLSIFEAAASGLPVIITDAPPMNEFIVNDSNGKLVPVKTTIEQRDNYWPLTECDESKLRDSMQWFIDHRASVGDYSRATRRYAEEHFDWSRNSYALADTVEQLERIEKPSDPNFMNALRRYEHSWNRYPPILEPIAPMLRSIGVGRIKRKVSRDLGLKKD
jgi:glycosyltransferase involved in cell wall biosynthesis